MNFMNGRNHQIIIQKNIQNNYWEHFGKMDNESYAKKTIAKLRFYVDHGIIPGGQLITTYETLEKPLSLETVENVIKEYFM